jgi:hypothetical protein
MFLFLIIKMYYFQEIKTVTDPKTLNGVTTKLAQTTDYPPGASEFAPVYDMFQ